MTERNEMAPDPKRPFDRLVKNLLCRIGLHKRDRNWILKWSSGKYYCKCERCDRYIPEGSLFTYDEESFYKYF